MLNCSENRTVWCSDYSWDQSGSDLNHMCLFWLLFLYVCKQKSWENQFRLGLRCDGRSDDLFLCSTAIAIQIAFPMAMATEGKLPLMPIYLPSQDKWHLQSLPHSDGDSKKGLIIPCSYATHACTCVVRKLGMTTTVYTLSWGPWWKCGLKI